MTDLTLAHLYPREMNIYGDTGNVLVLAKRMQWRGMLVRVVPIEVGTPLPPEVDIIVCGGGQDAAQGELGADFVSRAATLRAMADDGVVMLAICGAYQLLGHEFLTKDGLRIPGAGVLDVTTRGSDTRMIGNNHVHSPWGSLVGFENHSGLTELGTAVHPLGNTLPGRGNNGRDRTEGATRDNVFGTYLHGPVLAKSPQFADELLTRALARRGAQLAGPDPTGPDTGPGTTGTDPAPGHHTGPDPTGPHAGRRDAARAPAPGPPLAPLAPLDDELAHLAAKVAIGRPR